MTIHLDPGHMSARLAPRPNPLTAGITPGSFQPTAMAVAN
jgi:hypothetical protein